METSNLPYRPPSISTSTSRNPGNRSFPQASLYSPPSSTSRRGASFYGPRPGTAASIPSSSRDGTPFATGTYARPSTRLSLAPSVPRVSTPYHSSRPPTRASASINRPATAASHKSFKGSSSLTESGQEVICAVTEGRGITPTVGICFVIVTTGEVLMSQICDNQFYVKTLHKIRVHEPGRILVLATAYSPNPKSTLYSLIEEHVEGAPLVAYDRRFWSETAGLQYVKELSFKEDTEAIKVAIEGNFYATSSFAATMRYLELECQYRIAPHSLRIRYQPSEDTMMIDISAIQSLELIQNLRDARSKDCLYGLLNQTLTPMGARMLRNNILQPSTLVGASLTTRYDAVEELTTNEDMFTAARDALKGSMDVEELLPKLIIRRMNQTIPESEQAINNVLIIKKFLESIPVISQALAPAQSALLRRIRQLCRPEITGPTLRLILDTIRPEVTYMKTALDLQKQRTFAIQSGTNGFLDVARRTYQEGTEDVLTHVEQLKTELKIGITLKFEAPRMYCLRVKAGDFKDRPVPDVLISQVHKKGGIIECQTLTLRKLNKRIADSAADALFQTQRIVNDLLEAIRLQVPNLFRVCESVALLDMMLAFAQLSTVKDYVRPVITDTLALKTARHPLLDSKLAHAFVPNDYYATQEHRFQIVTGPNMSGKTTYTRAIALLQIMAQIGCFVPAEYAAFPVIHNIFARVTTDDSIESNLSTFSVEMREMAFILRNVDCRSIAIIDELGRGTNTRDGLSIALAMSEALIQSKALVWFATHFKELADILSDRPGVMNLHLATATRRQNGAISGMTMLYKVASGVVRDDHYGIALAKTMGFPDSFVSFAERVANDLSRKREAAKQSSEAAKLVKKRKLVLNLDETLRRVVDAGMETGALWGFLERLQGEFVDKMAGLEEEDIEQGVEGGEERDGMEIDDDEGEGSTSGDEDMEDEM